VGQGRGPLLGERDCRRGRRSEIGQAGARARASRASKLVLWRDATDAGRSGSDGGGGGVFPGGAPKKVEFLIQVDIGGHPPFPTGSKQFSGNCGNLLFLAVLTSGAILRA
jgi:hypothetical protein